MGNDAESRMNLQSENFDEHLDNAEFDENIPGRKYIVLLLFIYPEFIIFQHISIDNTNSNKISTDLEAEFEGEYEGYFLFFLR